MENFQLLLDGFQVVFTMQNVGAAFLGAILGLIVGAMPGIGSLAGVALLLPLTYKFNPTTAIIMLGALYYSNMYGGSFSAILLNIPGDSPAVCTALDGYPMAKNKNGIIYWWNNRYLYFNIYRSFISRCWFKIWTFRNDSIIINSNDIYKLACWRKSN
mgnify:CR=1 FL=1